MDASRLPKSFRKYADRVESVEDYRASGEGYWVHLACGWRTPDGETHSIHEETITECARDLRDAEVCTVPGCCKVPLSGA